MYFLISCTFLPKHPFGVLFLVIFVNSGHDLVDTRKNIRMILIDKWPKTHWIQNPVSAMVCRFESDPRHRNKPLLNWRGFLFPYWITLNHQIKHLIVFWWIHFGGYRLQNLIMVDTLGSFWDYKYEIHSP